jgi:hypothetical protein
MSKGRALLWTLWWLSGPLLLVCMTIWNGWPLPYGAPIQNGPLAVLGFVAVTSFVYALPVWLIVSGRRLRLGKGAAK